MNATLRIAIAGIAVALYSVVLFNAATKSCDEKYAADHVSVYVEWDDGQNYIVILDRDYYSPIVESVQKAGAVWVYVSDHSGDVIYEWTFDGAKYLDLSGDLGW